MSELVNQAIQPEILTNILLLAGYVTGVNKRTNYLFKKNIIYLLRLWFERIKVKTKFSDIPINQFPFLIQLYQTRIQDRPRYELIPQLAERGFDLSFFYSKEHQLDQKSLSYIDSERIEEVFVDIDDNDHKNADINRTNKRLLQELTEIAKQYFDFSKLRAGDTLRFLPGDLYQCLLIWDGTQLLYLPTNYDRDGNLPLEIIIQDYPLVDYFKFTLRADRIIWLRSTEKELKLLKTFGDKFWKFQTTDGYIIYADKFEESKTYMKHTILPYDYLTNLNQREFRLYLEDINIVDLKTTVEIMADFNNTLLEHRLVLSTSEYIK